MIYILYVTLVTLNHYDVTLQALWRISSDRKILATHSCVTVLLSYLPEAGQYSCFFVYLTLVSILYVN